MAVFTKRIWAFDVKYGQGRNKTHSGYVCWLMKMCGMPLPGDDEPKRWRKMLQTMVTVLRFGQQKNQFSQVDTRGWREFLLPAQAAMLGVLASHSQEARAVRKEMDLVSAHREWSLSYAQLSLFVDACGAVLVGMETNDVRFDDPLMREAKIMEKLGLIAVQRDGAARPVLVDGDLVLLTNHILDLSTETRYCKMTAETFLLIAFFMVMGDEKLRGNFHSQCKTMHAVCFFGKISMLYVGHLQHFFQGYLDVADKDMSLFVELLVAAQAVESGAL